MQRLLEMEAADEARMAAQQQQQDQGPKLSKKELKALKKKEEKLAAKRAKKEAKKKEKAAAAAAAAADGGEGGAAVVPGDVPADPLQVSVYLWCSLVGCSFLTSQCFVAVLTGAGSRGSTTETPETHVGRENSQGATASPNSSNGEFPARFHVAAA